MPISILAWAIMILLLLTSPAFAQKQCDQFRSSTVASAQSITEIIPGIEGKRIYLCGMAFINSGASLTVGLFSGTGSNCNVDQTILISPITMPTNTTFVNRVATAAGEYTPVGHSVCLQITGNGNLTTMWYWTQF
jgi:hypothetical protein